MSIRAKLAELGVALPDAPKPLAAYVPAVRVGNLIYSSGQLPLLNGALVSGGKGKVGLSVTKEEAKAAARQCAINALAAMAACVGDVENIERIVKLTVFVASESGFSEQPFVANGASEFFQEVFGENGRHARSAVGVAELPMSASVEVEAIGVAKP
ncbi:MAG: RidA family protein [Chloroherpetonaceae bacterium]|nr:RidA family protein [Chloroherpetonaceae bacterium]MDW8437602.1 RidA family protein [Chloroherpetonaceae bacterium]